MRTIGLEELRKRLGVVVAAAGRGQAVTILCNGHPIARLVPFAGDPGRGAVQGGTTRYSRPGQSTDCPECGTLLDPNGACFVCRPFG